MDKEMIKALEADGEKLRAMTGEDHGPFYVEAIDVATDAIMRAAELARIGREMRDAQRAYFRLRSSEHLIASKQAEKAFDNALDAFDRLRAPGGSGE
jgi:hypothetical protein